MKRMMMRNASKSTTASVEVGWEYGMLDHQFALIDVCQIDHRALGIDSVHQSLSSQI
jgi:hypothetical protein